MTGLRGGRGWSPPSQRVGEAPGRLRVDGGERRPALRRINASDAPQSGRCGHARDHAAGDRPADRPGAGGQVGATSSRAAPPTDVRGDQTGQRGSPSRRSIAPLPARSSARTRPGSAAWTPPPSTGAAAPQRAPPGSGSSATWSVCGLDAIGVTVMVIAGESSFPALRDIDQVTIGDAESTPPGLPTHPR